VAFESIDDYNDVETRNLYREQVDEKGRNPRSVMQIIHAKSRDNARTPMQWDAGAQAGFTTGTPWLKVNPNYKEINVAQATADSNSIFHYYRELIELRKTNPVIVYGSYELILPEHAQIYAFTRTLGEERLLVILNFSQEPVVFTLPGDFEYSRASLLIGNYPVDPAGDIRSLTLQPYEARVYRVTGHAQ